MTTRYREWSAFREEIVQRAINLLTQRLNEEQQSTIVTTMAFLESSDLESFLRTGRILSEYLFPDQVSKFVENACDCWDSILLLHLDLMWEQSFPTEW